MPTKPFRLLHVTDHHLHAHSESRMRGLNTYDTLLAVIEHVRAGELKPDAVLATGDLVQDETRKGYERFKKLLGASMYRCIVFPAIMMLRRLWQKC